MKRISSISSIGGQRLKAHVVERKTFTGSVDKVSGVGRIDGARNDLQNENYAISNDSFYEHLRKSQKRIKDFVMNEHELKEQIMNEENRPLNRDSDEIYINVQKAVKSINECMKSIKIIDSLIGGEGYKGIIHSQEAKYMEKIGIRVKNGFFEIDSAKLKNEIQREKSCVDIIFDPESGMLKKTFLVLERVKERLIQSNMTKKEGEIIDRMV
ncbi:hypothetical protein SAMN02745945_00582 [Peptoclostridium litorale DSM 5388]|uniref:Uncharacterized protein n=1 Tax=Peptoclostridium litorale DSM 5388 TaxID=1121324 RepID=A0A069RFT0_PEPLI|nr:hypothetical protein [Peptoclostridium litorale]KDR95050.1 hypothetical protein CLIT_11c00790 [Peptoclostridium litorale DSM 5388]SIN75854.1 hypothetical protein SAMN02745945_00582 [Peptoclostridium litorale DSM 5388]